MLVTVASTMPICWIEAAMKNSAPPTSAMGTMLPWPLGVSRSAKGASATVAMTARSPRNSSGPMCSMAVFWK